MCLQESLLRGMESVSAISWYDISSTSHRRRISRKYTGSSSIALRRAQASPPLRTREGAPPVVFPAATTAIIRASDIIHEALAIGARGYYQSHIASDLVDAVCVPLVSMRTSWQLRETSKNWNADGAA